MSLKHPVEALNLDFKQQRLFVNYFKNLPEKPTSTVRFFSHTDYYTTHGDDATRTSAWSGNLMKYMGEEPQLSYVVLRKSQFERFVRELLLVKQYRVEVYVKAAPNKINEWQLEYKGSPGNLAQFEEILFETSEIVVNNYVMGVRVVQGKVVAAACVNATEWKFEVCEIKDNDCFTELEALIAQVGPKECIIPHGDTADLIALKNVLDRNGALVAKVKKSDFNTTNIAQDLNELLRFDEGQQKNSLSLPETQLTEALGCLNAVIKFLNLKEDEKNANQFSIKTVDIHRYVRLDNAALYSLNILPKPGGDDDFNSRNQAFCLKRLLDKCITAQGRRLLDQWLKQPLKDVNLIDERLEMVECFVKSFDMKKTMMDVLKGLPDLLLLSRKLSSKKATLQDCYRVYQIVSTVPVLVGVLKDFRNATVKSALVHQLEEIYSDLSRYQSMIEAMLDLDLVDVGEFLIKRSYCPELTEIGDTIQQVKEKMQRVLGKTARDLRFDEKNIKLERNDQHGYHFRVTLKEETALRKNSSYTVLDAVKNGVRFTNSKLSALNSDYNEAKSSYEEEQKEIIKEVLDVACSYGECLRSLNIHVATIDVLVSFAGAAAASRIPYIRPKLHESGRGPMRLTGVRHPCIELQEHVTFIPNSVEFDHDDKTLHIITGPNMCGKSTYIKSVGVCVLMAQIGSFVPCSYAEIPLVDAILSRVGAEDSQVRGLSTFMVEMIETSSIINNASRNSLVIIDELGRGTSTYDGCGIAFAIAEYMAKEIECFALFATHFHEIAVLAEVCSTISNKHLSAVTTKDTITPLYHVQEGECDNSYGIYCARMAGFPEDVIESALEHQKRLEHAQGVQFIKDFEPSLKRQKMKEGDDIIKECLEKVRSLRDKGLGKEELFREVAKIKDELSQCDNLFIKGLLAE